MVDFFDSAVADPSLSPPPLGFQKHGGLFDDDDDDGKSDEGGDDVEEETSDSLVSEFTANCRADRSW